jgi:hypothetical protein
VIAELPGYRSGIRVTRTELERLIAPPLDGVLAALEKALERNRVSWSNVSALVTIGGGASIPLITQRLSEHSQAPVVTTPQPALDAAVGAALFAAYGAEADVKTGVAPVPPADVLDPVVASDSATFRALAWSQDDDTADDVVPYTGDVYDTDVTTARPQAQYVPPTEPIEEPRTWQRLPQLVFGLAAVVAVVAVGGVAVALTSASDSTNATPPPLPPHTATSAPGPTSAAPPPPSTPPPVQTVTVTSEPPPSPPSPTPTTTVPPVTTTTHYTTTTPSTTTPTTTTPTTTTTTATTTTTTTETTTTTTTTTPAMTTTYINVPFVPVPIPIQVPQTQAPQTPQYPYQQPQYPYQAPPQYPYQYQQPPQIP